MVSVVAILVLASLGIGYLAGGSGRAGETITSTTTANSIGTSTTMSTAMIATSSVLGTTLPLGCSQPSQGDGFTNGTVEVGSTSPAIICIQFYLFDSNTNITLGTTGILLPPTCESAACESLVSNATLAFEANLTVTASQDQLVLGGSANANEGTVVAYSITGKPGATGTFPLTLHGSALDSADYILSQGLATCPLDFDLVAGNGQPNYVPPPHPTTGCAVVDNYGILPESFGIPGVSYRLPPDILCYRVISLTNSTP